MALSVNVVELACSIGIPQAYTKILDLNRVDLWQREFLMSIYTAHGHTLRFLILCGSGL